MNDIILIGPDHYNMLGLIRSLGEKGITPNVVVYASKRPFVLKSKYIKHGVTFSCCDERIIKYLVNNFSNVNEPAIIVCTSDKACQLIDNNLGLLKCFIVSSCNHVEGALSKLMDKYEMNLKAEQIGLDIPNSIRINTDTFIDFNEIHCPCIVKPLESVYGNKSDIQVCENIADLKKTVAVFRKQKVSVLVQEYIIAKQEIGIMGYSFFNSAKVWLPDVIVKRRFSNKSAVFCDILPSQVVPELADTLKKIEQLVLFIGYKGIFDIDLLYGNNKIYFIEMNLRNGAYGYGLTKAGVNFAFTLYQEVTKGEINLGEIRCRSHMMCEFSDYKHHRSNGVNIFTWLKNYFCSKHMVIQLKDWKPVIAYIIGKLK